MYHITHVDVAVLSEAAGPAVLTAAVVVPPVPKTMSTLIENTLRKFKGQFENQVVAFCCNVTCWGKPGTCT